MLSFTGKGGSRYRQQADHQSGSCCDTETGEYDLKNNLNKAKVLAAAVLMGGALTIGGLGGYISGVSDADETAAQVALLSRSPATEKKEAIQTVRFTRRSSPATEKKEAVQTVRFTRRSSPATEKVTAYRKVAAHVVKLRNEASMK